MGEDKFIGGAKTAAKQWVQTNRTYFRREHLKSEMVVPIIAVQINEIRNNYNEIEVDWI